MKSFFLSSFLLLLIGCSGDDSFSLTPQEPTPTPEPTDPDIPSNPQPDFPTGVEAIINIERNIETFVATWEGIPDKFTATLCQFDLSQTNYCQSIKSSGVASNPLIITLNTDLTLDQLLTQTYFVLFTDSSSDSDFINTLSLDFTKELIDQLIQYIKAPNAQSRTEFGYSVAMNASGNRLIIGSRFENTATNDIEGSNVLTSSGAFYLFSKGLLGWKFLDFFKHPNPDTGDHFGHHVAISDDGFTIAVSIPGDDAKNNNSYDNDLRDSGSIAIFRQASGAWTVTALLKSNVKAAGMKFGEGSMTLSPDGATLAVGHYSGVQGSALGDNNERVEIFRIAFGTTWVYSQTLKSFTNSDSEVSNENDLFGFSLAFDDDASVLAISAIEDDSATVDSPTSNLLTDSGSVYIYNRSGSTYQRVKYLKPDTPIANQRFGNSLSFSSNGNILAVGSERTNAVYLYDSASNAWLQRYELTVSDLQEDDKFGQQVILNDAGDRLFVGAMDDNEATGFNGAVSSSTFYNLGGIYVLDLTATDWSQKYYLKPPTIDRADYLGYSAVIDFNKNRLGASHFSSIAISDDGQVLVAGAPGEDSDAKFINGETNNNAPSAGAAYVYQF